MFSQYVIKAIEEIGSAKLIDKHTAVTQLRNAAERAESSQDTDILKTISGVLSMGYSFESNSYEPMFVMSTGARSFSIDDIHDEDIAILENALETLLPTWACAQLADILCIKCSFAQYGRLAVSEYLNLFDETFDPDNWVDCWDAIRRAFDIAVRQGKNSDPFMQVKTHINQTLYRLDGRDPLFLSLNLVQLIYKYASNDELENYLEIASKIFNKHIADQDNECYVIEDAFQTQEALLKQLKREHDIHDVKRRLALFYENLADRLKIDGWNGAHREINALQKACKLYNKNSDQGKVLEIRKQIEELQRTAFSGISGVPFKIDTTSLYNNVNKLFHGLTLQEMIVQLGRTVLIYQKDDVKQRVLEEHQKYIFKSMFGSRFVDKNHRVVSNIPPLDFHNPEADQELLHKHMVQYVNRNWEVAMSISLETAEKSV